MENIKIVCKGMLVAFFAMVLLLAATSCIRYVGYQGSGDARTEERTVSGFESVSVSTGINLYIEQTGAESLRIEAEGHIVPRIVTEVSNRKLTIRFDRMVFGTMRSARPVNVYLTVKDLHGISLSSGSNAKSELIQTERIQIDLSSGSNAEIQVDAQELSGKLSSGANLSVSGTAGQQDIRLGSGSRYDGEDLVSQQARVNVSSGGIATIHVDESLDATVSSGGTIRYYGDPQVTSSVTSGGQVISMSKS